MGAFKRISETAFITPLVKFVTSERRAFVNAVETSGETKKAEGKNVFMGVAKSIFWEAIKTWIDSFNKMGVKNQIGTKITIITIAHTIEAARFLFFTFFWIRL